MTQQELVSGAQALRRGLRMLRLLGQNQQDGVRLSEAVTLSGLERTTTHRLLQCMVEEQFAEKDEKTKRYRLGIHSMQLGSAAVRKMPLVARFKPMMQRLARMSGDTVFLLVRDGDEVVCLHREEGPYPIKVFTVSVGGRQLLGAVSGGLALLATLDDAEIDENLKRNQAAYERYGLSHSFLWRTVREARRAGHAVIVELVTPGVAGLAAAVPAALNVQAAVAFGTITQRFTPTRQKELAALLHNAYADLMNGQLP
ncbi:MAG: IclR family transcriptional regulator [Burkholderiaceae bacterium]|nr:IclR family transcriptional regulator [Desulfobacterales bacterium]MDP3135187.1 IclR family transcriptional regulator [Burkholderiaceae bacterium]